MRFKKLVALLTVSVYFLSITTPALAVGAMPGVDGSGSSAIPGVGGWVTGSAAVLSPTDTSGPLRVMKSALYPGSYKNADENSGSSQLFGG